MTAAESNLPQRAGWGASLLAILCGGLAASPVATHLQPDLAGPEPAVVAASEDLDDLVRQVKKEKDRVDARIFQRISRHRTPESLKALDKVIGYLKQEGILNQAYAAHTQYLGQKELEEDAVEQLTKAARKHKKEEHQRAATRALASFGPKAEESLRVIAEGHKDGSVRGIAVQALLDVLAKENTLDAVELIVENARLQFPGQRERVEIALRKMESEEINAYFVKHVENDSLEIELRLLLMEVLADRNDPQVDALILDLMNDEEPQLLLRAVEMAGNRQTVAAELALTNLVNVKGDPIVRAAIVALAQLRGQDEAWQQDVFEFAAARRAAQRMGAAAALGLLRNSVALERLHQLLSDPERTVRIEALQATGNLRRRDSIPALIGRLGVERGRIKENIAATLRLFTGLDLGTLPSTWQRWWDSEGKDKALPPYEEALAAEQERNKKRSENLSQSTFYGLQVVSDRVVFIMDVSGSMQQPARGRGGRTSSNPRGGSTRLSVAKEELKRVLTTFPNGDWFNLIFFEGSVRSWLDGLEEMDDDAREDATEFLMRQRAQGGTAVYDALERAFEDEQIDTIYLLSDGDPSVGKVIDPGRIRFEVQRWNATRKIQINTISIGQRSQLLRWLAEDSSGRYVEVL